MSRLGIQEYPSTNTIAVMVNDGLDAPAVVLSELYNLCYTCWADIQAFVTRDFAIRRLVKVTFFDVRKTMECMQCLQADPRFLVVLDFAGGTNRSLVIPSEGYSLDAIYKKFRTFGDIEKIWIQANQLVIDYFDSRSLNQLKQ